MSTNDTLNNAIGGVVLLGATKIVVDKAFPKPKRKYKKMKAKKRR
jgi:hypothetical protein